METFGSDLSRINLTSKYDAWTFIFQGQTPKAKKYKGQVSQVTKYTKK